MRPQEGKIQDAIMSSSLMVTRLLIYGVDMRSLTVMESGNEACSKTIAPSWLSVYVGVENLHR